MAQSHPSRPRVTPQVKYRFVRLQQDPGAGAWIDGTTGMDHRQLIDVSAAQGWRFVQALPVGLDGREWDCVFEQPLHFRPLVIGHVPKTAGTSITSIIGGYMQHVVGLSVASILQYGHMIPYTDLRPLRQLPPFVRLVSGHFGVEHYQLLLRTDPFILVSLRDPFERFLSTLEHEYRDAAACPETAEAALRERYGRILSVIERIVSGRGDATVVRQALADLRGDYVLAADYLVYGGRPIAHAWIDSSDVERLCAALAASADDPAATSASLGSLARLNVFPRQLFLDFDTADRRRLNECFMDVFEDEVSLVEGIKRDTPSLFADDTWATFLECLWRQQGTATQR